MSVISFSLTGLSDEILKENLNMKLPSIVDSYYQKGVEYPVFPWNARHNSGTEDSGTELDESERSETKTR